MSLCQSLKILTKHNIYLYRCTIGSVFRQGASGDPEIRMNDNKAYQTLHASQPDGATREMHSSIKSQAAGDALPLSPEGTSGNADVGMNGNGEYEAVSLSLTQGRVQIMEQSTYYEN